MISETLDPRIRRTRLALQQALAALIKRKDFEKISVQDIAEEAGLNRATFYDHYADKFALLESTVTVHFGEHLTERGVTYNGGCIAEFKAVILSVCDFLAAARRLDCDNQLHMGPHFESAIIAAVRKLILAGFEPQACETARAPEMTAAAASWAIYGAAKEWVSAPDRCPAEEIVDTIVALVHPIFQPEMAPA